MKELLQSSGLFLSSQKLQLYNKIRSKQIRIGRCIDIQQIHESNPAVAYSLSCQGWLPFLSLPSTCVDSLVHAFYTNLVVDLESQSLSTSVCGIDIQVQKDYFKFLGIWDDGLKVYNLTWDNFPWGNSFDRDHGEDFQRVAKFPSKSVIEQTRHRDIALMDSIIRSNILPTADLLNESSIQPLCYVLLCDKVINFLDLILANMNDIANGHFFGNIIPYGALIRQILVDHKVDMKIFPFMYKELPLDRFSSLGAYYDTMDMKLDDDNYGKTMKRLNKQVTSKTIELLEDVSKRIYNIEKRLWDIEDRLDKF